MATRRPQSHIMIAAITAGIVDGIITYPVETLKIRMQTEAARMAEKDRKERAAAAAAAKGGAATGATAAAVTVRPKITTLGTAKQIWSEGGVGGFFPGLGYHLMGELTKSLWRFTLFEGVKKAYMRSLSAAGPKGDATVRDNVVISILSATGETFLVVQPWDRLKIMGIGGASPLAVARKVYREEGLRGLVSTIYKGLDMTWIRQIGNVTSAFTVFYWLKDMTLRMHPERKVLTPTEKFVFGGIGGALGSFATMPIDVVKSNKQREVATKGSRSTATIFRDIYHREGVGAFYRGTGARAALLFLKRALAFYCYETILEALDRVR